MAEQKNRAEGPGFFLGFFNGCEPGKTWDDPEKTREKNFGQKSCQIEKIASETAPILGSQRPLFGDCPLDYRYLEKENEQPQKEIGDKILLSGFSEEIVNLLWLNNSYIIFQINGSIRIAETDSRSKVNLIELTTFPQPKVHWQQKQKTLLVLSEGNLFICDNLLR